MKDLLKSSRDYEKWLAQRMPLIRTDLIARRRKMAESAFAFLRGSFFRWVELWPALCAELVDASKVLGVGDLHVENFGTWRAADGQLIWGVNDFDEAAVLPYTNDLVRLATSALLSGLKVPARTACARILKGYQASLERGGQPLPLAARREWVRAIGTDQSRRDKKFWRELTQLPTVRTPIEPALRRALQHALATRRLALRVVHRRGGLGSLGRPRYTALASLEGGTVASEGKRLTASAWSWRDDSARPRLQYARAVQNAVRIPDSSLRLVKPWVIRRVAPDCRRIELKDLPRGRNRRALLAAMGWETANVHLGTHGKRASILHDLKTRNEDWLIKAAQEMAHVTTKEWRLWRKLVAPKHQDPQRAPAKVNRQRSRLCAVVRRGVVRNCVCRLRLERSTGMR